MIYIFESTLEQCRCFQHSRRAWEMFLFRRWEKAENGGLRIRQALGSPGFMPVRQFPRIVSPPGRPKENQFSSTWKCRLSLLSSSLPLWFQSPFYFPPINAVSLGCQRIVELWRVSEDRTNIVSNDRNKNQITEANETTCVFRNTLFTENSILFFFFFSITISEGSAAINSKRHCTPTFVLHGPRVHTARALISTRFTSRSRIFFHR